MSHPVHTQNLAGSTPCRSCVCLSPALVLTHMAKLSQTSYSYSSSFSACHPPQGLAQWLTLPVSRALPLQTGVAAASLMRPVKKEALACFPGESKAHSCP